MLKKLDIIIVANILLIVVALAFFNHSDIDTKIQAHLFNPENKTWFFDAAEPTKKFIFYQLPKILLGIFIVAILALTAAKFKNKTANRHKFLLIFLGLAIIPLTVGNIKKFTNIYCPNQLEIYNGKYPHIKILEPYPEDFAQPKKGQCFPAGHAVTGFALLILFFALESTKNRYLALLTATTLGWILGFYQMAKGAHFFSHNFISMLACFLVAAIIARIYNCINNETRTNYDNAKNYKKTNSRTASRL